jgi:lipoic acid synthetase
MNSRRALKRLPVWFKQEIPQAVSLRQLSLLKNKGINTVCVEARCPNLSRCFKEANATFLILGDVCSRNCPFCGVRKSNGSKLDVDFDEPRRLVNLVEALNLRYVVITSVCRDDLSDAGAGIFAQTITRLHQALPFINTEVLVPDFKGKYSSLKTVIEAGPQVLGHNLETVPRLYKLIRPQADYYRSLEVLSRAKQSSIRLFTKSALLLGLGEQEKEVLAVMQELASVGCDILVLGQYLAPSRRHYPVKEFLPPEQFDYYRSAALDLGFRFALSAPLARSSYKAEEIYNKLHNQFN